MERTPEEKKKVEQELWIQNTMQEIVNLAKYLDTKDMHLAGIIYLASIVRRRAKPHFEGVEVRRASGS